MPKLSQNVREKVHDGAAHEVRVRQTAPIRMFPMRLSRLPEDPRGAPSGPQTRHPVQTGHKQKYCLFRQLDDETVVKARFLFKNQLLATNVTHGGH